ncbi:fimbrial protein [Serratia nevei]|uniref:fimbrial protein n=1 Tax=Serratia nevei TaxID=2703794 RepID=UPI00301B48DA
MKAKRLGILLAVWTALGLTGPAVAADNMLFHGALVAEPCTLQPGDEDIRLEFDTVIDKYLYSYGRTAGKAFSLTLLDCDLSLGKTVRVTFSGSESRALPGLLAPDGGSQASGIALGLETTAGVPVALNQPGDGYALVNGSNQLRLQAYIQGEPQAIAQKKIGLGAFSSVATFTLEYE